MTAVHGCAPFTLPAPPYSGQVSSSGPAPPPIDILVLWAPPAWEVLGCVCVHAMYCRWLTYSSDSQWESLQKQSSCISLERRINSLPGLNDQTSIKLILKTSVLVTRLPPPRLFLCKARTDYWWNDAGWAAELSKACFPDLLKTMDGFALSSTCTEAGDSPWPGFSASHSLGLWAAGEERGLLGKWRGWPFPSGPTALSLSLFTSPAHPFPLFGECILKVSLKSSTVTSEESSVFCFFPY